MSALDDESASVEQAVGTAVTWSDVPIWAAAGRPETSSPLITWKVRRAIVTARAALVAFRLDEASKAVNQLSLLLSTPGYSRPICFGFALRILQACVFVASDQSTDARELLATVPSTPRYAIATVLLRYLHWQGDEAGQTVPLDAGECLTLPKRSAVVEQILSYSVGAAIAFEQLRLTMSAALATEALLLARARYGNDAPICSLPAILLAQVAYEQGRLAEAESLLRPRALVIRSSGISECVIRASLLLARLSLHRGQHRAALATLREAERLGRTRRWPRLVCAASTETSRALSVIRYHKRRCSETLHGLARGPSQHAMISDLPPEFGVDVPLQNEAITFSTLDHLLRTPLLVTSAGWNGDLCARLVRYLGIGADRGLHMIFVDAGGAVLAALERLYIATPGHASRMGDLHLYIATLLRSASPTSADKPMTGAYRALSRREAGILRMIAQGQSNKHIAQSLGIAPETVKSHTKSIFIKLETRTRAQAVARAESIGLL